MNYTSRQKIYYKTDEQTHKGTRATGCTKNWKYCLINPLNNSNKKVMDYFLLCESLFLNKQIMKMKHDLIQQKLIIDKLKININSIDILDKLLCDIDNMYQNVANNDQKIICKLNENIQFDCLKLHKNISLPDIIFKNDNIYILKISAYNERMSFIDVNKYLIDLIDYIVDNINIDFYQKINMDVVIYFSDDKNHNSHSVGSGIQFDKDQYYTDIDDDNKKLVILFHRYTMHYDELHNIYVKYFTIIFKKNDKINNNDISVLRFIKQIWNKKLEYNPIDIEKIKQL